MSDAVVGTLKLALLPASLIFALGVWCDSGASRAVADTVGAAPIASYRTPAMSLADGGGSMLDCGRSGGHDDGDGASLGKSIDDSVITTKVRAMLLTNGGGGATDISVETRAGRVKLTGAAASREQIKSMGQAACAVKGVKTVDNNITLKK